jgi:hypothetical protein
LMVRRRCLVGVNKSSSFRLSWVLYLV